MGGNKQNVQVRKINSRNIFRGRVFHFRGKSKLEACKHASSKSKKERCSITAKRD